MSAVQELKEQLQAAAAAPGAFPEDRFEGRGIVICAGGARLFTCAWVAIGILRRHLDCSLPIEVWHLGPDEMGPPMRGLIEEMGAEPVDAFEVAKRHAVVRLGGWELKPYAVMHSRFREILLLDADNVPVREPSFLFERPEFRDTGALFWPDIVRLSADNDIWPVSGLAFRDIPAFESGQMVLDKSKCWRALVLAHWINQHSKVFYRMLHGDKDTFLIAWLIQNQPFHLVRHPPKLLDSTMCQRDPDGAPLFQHRNGAKWILDGGNPRVRGFRFEDECRALIDELAGQWDGRIFNPPLRSSNVRRLEDALSRTRTFTYTRLTSDEQQIELMPDHRIHGGGNLERYWYVAEKGEGPELRFEGMGLPCCALRPSTNGKWRGRFLQPPHMAVELAPAEMVGAEPKEQRPEPPSNAAAMALFGPVLELAAALPWDRQVARDIVGALRTLALLDPSVGKRLEDESRRLSPKSGRGRVVQAALAGLAERSRRPDLGGVESGNNWLAPPFKLGRGYRS